MNHPPREEKRPPIGKPRVLTVAESDRALLALHQEVEQLRLELTALKAFMKVANPSFAELFPHLLEKTRHDVDPEAH